MVFNISGFTHKGTGSYKENEDHILINGNLYNEGEFVLKNQKEAICFVSDGVGGSKGGIYASEFVLFRVDLQAKENPTELLNSLYQINNDLVKETARVNHLRGCACTLSGIIANEEFEEFYHVGDSEIWLFRNEMFLKISKDEVIDEDNPGSPLINYFGGEKAVLQINNDWQKPEILAEDILLLCSDGLFKSLKVKDVKLILQDEVPIEEKIMMIKTKCLEAGSEDNVSAILIEVVDND